LKQQKEYLVEKENHKNTLSNTWLKATVIGSLWASFEIIIGSLLHNLRVPFAGTFLAGIAVVFLIAFFQVWNEKGLIWRAGLICALMKAISPSSVILGPMIGIITEAFILEISIRLLGRNVLAYITGGALAIASALLHKIINLIILYGFNLIDIYVNLINYASRQFGMSESAPINLLYALILIYLIIGVLAALLGYFTGRRARGIYPEKRSYMLPDAPIPKTNQPNRFSVLMLCTHIIIIVAVMYVFSVYENFLVKLGLTIFYAVFSILYYRNIGRKLLKPLFWMQLLFILLLAMLFLKAENGSYSWQNGFFAGMEMIFRAIIIIVGFSSISRELANPAIKNYLIINGFEKSLSFPSTRL
jgi:hypothetical protein